MAIHNLLVVFGIYRGGSRSLFHYHSCCNTLKENTTKHKNKTPTQYFRYVFYKTRYGYHNYFWDYRPAITDPFTLNLKFVSLKCKV